MRKIKYLFTRIKNMNYQNFFKTINIVHQRSGKNRLYLFWDIIYCGLKYQAGYLDYKLFEMYNLNRQERKTIITRGINNELIAHFNDPIAAKVFRNKIAFNEKFNKYLKRDWLKLDGNNLAEFKEFTSKHQTVIVKPIDECCGRGIRKITVNPKNAQKTYEDLIKNGQLLVEEIATQCQAISRLHPSSINTIRVVTLKGEVVAAYLRIGNHNNIVDNFNHGGMAAPINIETGIIDYPAIDKDQIIYESHPLTKEAILWFQIPKWPKIKDFCEKAAQVEPLVGYIGWDVCLSDNGPLLIEGNEFPGHDIYQLPPHRTNNQGLLPVFEAVIKKGEK